MTSLGTFLLFVVISATWLKPALAMMDVGRFASWDPQYDQPPFTPGCSTPPSFVFAAGENSPPYDIDSSLSMEPFPGCSPEYATLCAVQQSIRLVTRTREAVCDSLAAGGDVRAETLAGITDGLYQLEEAPGFTVYAFSVSSGEIVADSLRPDLVGQRLDGLLSSAYRLQPELLLRAAWVTETGGFLPHYSTRFNEALPDGNLSGLTSDSVVSYISACPSGDVIATSFKRDALPVMTRCNIHSNALCAIQNIGSLEGSILVDLLVANTVNEFSEILYDVSYTEKYKVNEFYVSVFEMSLLGYPGNDPPVADSQCVTLADGDDPEGFLGRNISDYLGLLDDGAEWERHLNSAAWRGGDFVTHPWYTEELGNYTEVHLVAGVVWDNTALLVTSGTANLPEPVTLGLSCGECVFSVTLPCTLVNVESLISHVHMQTLIPGTTWDDISSNPWFGDTGSAGLQNEYVGMWPPGFYPLITDDNGTVVASTRYPSAIGQNITSLYPGSWATHTLLVEAANAGGGWVGFQDGDRPSGSGMMIFCRKIRKGGRSFVLTSALHQKAWGPWNSSCSSESVSVCSNRNAEVIVGAAMGDILISRNKALRMLAFEDIVLRQGPYAASNTGDFRVYIYDSSWGCHEDFLANPNLGEDACPPELDNDEIEPLTALMDSHHSGWQPIAWHGNEAGEINAFVSRLWWKPAGASTGYEELHLLVAIGTEPSLPACDSSADCPDSSSCDESDGLCHCWSGHYANHTVVESECGGLQASRMQCIDISGLDCLADAEDDDSFSLASCKPCAPGYFCPAGTPTACLVGQYCPEGSASPVPCPAGSMSATIGQSSCEKCAPGTFSTTAASDSCTACSPGAHATGYGQSSCGLCEVGSYSNSSGADSCTSCGGGTTTSATGATSSSDCRFCRSQSSYFLEDHQACVACAWGFDTDSDGDTECQFRNDLLSVLLVASGLVVCVGGVGIILFRHFRKRMRQVVQQESAMMDETVSMGLATLNDFALPMVVMMAQTFSELSLSELEQWHEGNRDAHRLIWFDSLRQLQDLQNEGKAKLVMFTYPQGLNLHRSPTARQLASMQAAVKEVSAVKGWSEETVMVWLDSFSFPKDWNSVAELTFDTMYLYTKCPDAFIVVSLLRENHRVDLIAAYALCIASLSVCS